MKVPATLLSLVATLALADTARSHESAVAPVIHSIDHLRWETNALRRDSGSPPIETDFTYRQIEDPDYRLSIHGLWEERLAETWRASVWQSLAECESQRTWDYNGPSGFDGGLQFHPGTWDTYRPSDYPRYAYLATAQQQVVVARRVRAAEGWAPGRPAAPRSACADETSLMVRGPQRQPATLLAWETSAPGRSR